MAVIVSYYENQNATGSPRSKLGGPHGPTDDGWEWRYAGWVTDTTTHAKGGIEVRVETLDTDNLTQARGKILAALKAAAVAQGFTPTLALRDAFEAPVVIP